MNRDPLDVALGAAIVIMALCGLAIAIGDAVKRPAPTGPLPQRVADLETRVERLEKAERPR